MKWAIIFAPSCDIAAEALGGYERIDRALDPVIEGLSVNPYRYEKIESDFYQARYVVTRSVGDVPPLVWIFRIEANNDVLIVGVEAFEAY